MVAARHDAYKTSMGFFLSAEAESDL